MAAKIIKVTLDPDTADFSVDLTGFHGAGCSDVAKVFDALGERTKDIKKPEYKETIGRTVCK